VASVPAEPYFGQNGPEFSPNRLIPVHVIVVIIVPGDVIPIHAISVVGVLTVAAADVKIMKVMALTIA
jgi:hypothetical protein